MGIWFWCELMCSVVLWSDVYLSVQRRHKALAQGPCKRTALEPTWWQNLCIVTQHQLALEGCTHTKCQIQVLILSRLGHIFFFFFGSGLNISNLQLLRSVSLVWCDPACDSLGQWFFTSQSVYCLPPHPRKKWGKNTYMGQIRWTVIFHTPCHKVLSESKQYGLLLLQMVYALLPSCLCKPNF